MKLNGKALALALGLPWSGCLLVTGLLALQPLERSIHDL
ncbi:MAG: hypothetical protein ACI9EF_003255 [Pseudohongiellaceae bacterium]|jgi:hypothetical protein